MELVPPPATSPEVLATLSRFLAGALPPVLAALQAGAPRGGVERSLDELLRTLRLVGPLPAFKVRAWVGGGRGRRLGSWQRVVAGVAFLQPSMLAVHACSLLPCRPPGLLPMTHCR